MPSLHRNNSEFGVKEVNIILSSLLPRTRVKRNPNTRYLILQQPFYFPWNSKLKTEPFSFWHKLESRSLSRDNLERFFYQTDFRLVIKNRPSLGGYQYKIVWRHNNLTSFASCPLAIGRKLLVFFGNKVILFNSE